MSTAVVLFNRDLRVTDHPALTAALGTADEVVPVFVLDEALLARRDTAPNRVAFLLESLRDLRSSLVERGASLVVRRGDVVEELGRLVAEVGAESVHVSADVSGHARRRERAIAGVCRERGIAFERHPGVTAVEPGELSPSGGGAYQVFAAFWRAWLEVPRRDPLPAPEAVPLRATLATGRLPALDDLLALRPAGAPGGLSPERIAGGEGAGRERLRSWLADGIERYDERRDDLSADATSHLSADLHLGTVSPTELVARLDRRRRGHDAFLRQVAWREFNTALLAARPTLPREDLRPRGDRWSSDDVAIAAWRAGRTGYPVIDAGMRQLLREGWMHNRARMLVASFLTKHLRVDWRVGAAHFAAWLVDGDVANNTAQWQWVAGTGTDSRPNRVLNPWSQSERLGAAGYIRRHVPELAGLDDPDIHAPSGRPAAAGLDYPDPIVDHGAARDRFLTERGA